MPFRCLLEYIPGPKRHWALGITAVIIAFHPRKMMIYRGIFKSIFQRNNVILLF
jgi:hypothetical protein